MYVAFGDQLPASVRDTRWLRPQRRMLAETARRVILAIAIPLLLLACGSPSPTAPGHDPQNVPPPLHESEGVMALETSLGRAAAELVAHPAEIEPAGRVVLRVENRGDLGLAYGRPIMVERWNGHTWVETDESREAAWTMELIIVRARESGIEQRWPFLDARDPEPGWYSFTKWVQDEDVTGEPERVAVRARVRVTMPAN